MICCHCGENLPEGAVFCSNCGARCIKKLCSACGAELKEGQLFCHVCGLKYDEEAKNDEEAKKEQSPSSSVPRQEEKSPVKADTVQKKAAVVKKVFNIICRVAYVGMAVFWLYCAVEGVDYS